MISMSLKVITLFCYDKLWAELNKKKSKQKMFVKTQTKKDKKKEKKKVFLRKSN